MCSSRVVYLNDTVQPLEVCSGSKAGSYLRLIDSCITRLKAQGPGRTCYDRKGEEEEEEEGTVSRMPPSR